MPNDDSQLLRRSRLVSLLIMMSRVLGLVREQLLAALLAASAAAEAYNLAFRIPNLLRDLFAEGALSAAFVPTFARVYEKESKEKAFELGQRVLGALALVVGGLTILGYLFTEPLVELLAPGFLAIPGKAALTVTLTRVMLPFLLFLSCASVAMGMLNAQHVYGPPATASSAFNVVAIAFGVVLYTLGYSAEQTAFGWSLGVVLGGFAQLVVQLPSLYRTGFRLRFQFKIDDNVKKVMKLMGPATLGLAATQINLVVGSRLASGFPGTMSWLNYAFRLLYLPIGVFGVAIATVSSTSIARSLATGDRVAVRATLRQSLGLIGFLTVPSSVRLIVLAEPIIRMIYERGAFRGDDTSAVAMATAFYAFGLFAYSAVKILAPVFYAEQRPRIPLIASAAAVAANIIVSLVMRQYLGFLAMALGTAVAAWMNVVVLYAFLGKTPDDERPAELRLLASLAKTFLASLAMAGAGYALLPYAQAWAGRAEWSKWGMGLGITLACGAVFVVTSMVLGVPEVELFVGKLRARYRRAK